MPTLMTGLLITHDTDNARFFRGQYPDNPVCGRCGYPVPTIIPHSVPYNFYTTEGGWDERGCWAICENCHRNISDWEERWQYYVRLFELWSRTDQDITSDEKIDLYMNVKAGS